eukprot:4378804-Pyramimonas_sp.AAC.1
MGRLGRVRGPRRTPGAAMPAGGATSPPPPGPVRLSDCSSPDPRSLTSRSCSRTPVRSPQSTAAVGQRSETVRNHVPGKRSRI